MPMSCRSYQPPRWDSRKPVLEREAGLDLVAVLHVALEDVVAEVVQDVLCGLVVGVQAAREQVRKGVARRTAGPAGRLELGVAVAVARLVVVDPLVEEAALERVGAGHLGDVLADRDQPLLREQLRIEPAGVEQRRGVAPGDPRRNLVEPVAVDAGVRVPERLSAHLARIFEPVGEVDEGQAERGLAGQRRAEDLRQARRRRVRPVVGDHRRRDTAPGWRCATTDRRGTAALPPGSCTGRTASCCR